MGPFMGNILVCAPPPFCGLCYSHTGLVWGSSMLIYADSTINSLTLENTKGFLLSYVFWFKAHTPQWSHTIRTFFLLHLLMIFFFLREILSSSVYRAFLLVPLAEMSLKKKKLTIWWIILILHWTNQKNPTFNCTFILRKWNLSLRII